MLILTATEYPLTRTVVVLVLFVMVAAFAVMIVELDYRQTINKELRRRELETLQRKAELRRAKEQEAADDALLDEIGEYRHDFDEDHQAG